MKRVPSLKDCPFCGGKAEFNRHPGSWGYTPPTVAVGCKRCGFSLLRHEEEKWEQGRGHYDTTQQAWDAAAADWNKRA